MDLKLLISAMVVFCVISKVLSEAKCSPVVEYMWSFGEYCSVCSVMGLSQGKCVCLIKYMCSFPMCCSVCPLTALISMEVHFSQNTSIFLLNTVLCAL